MRLASVAADNDCAIRVGVNCGSVDPAMIDAHANGDSLAPMLASAWDHCSALDDLGFTRYCVSLKDSDPQKVIEVNRRFAERRPDVPLHLGVTEAGLPPDGIIKTRIAFEQLIGHGIGDTIRVSLTPRPGGDRREEVYAACELLQALGLRAFSPSVTACPGCGRTTSTTFQELAERIQGYIREQMPTWKTTYDGVETMTLAVMGCVVNGPGESKAANIGISLPGTGEAPNCPIFIDGRHHTTLRGTYEELAAAFQALVDDYVTTRYARKS